MNTSEVNKLQREIKKTAFQRVNTFIEIVPANTVVTFVGLFYSRAFPFPAALLQYNNTNYLVNPLGLIKLFKVSCFEELEDVYKHTKVLYKGFDTKDFVDKKGIHQTIKILKFDKIQ